MTGLREPGVCYQVPLGGLSVRVAGVDIDVSDTLRNGRANYVLFQRLTGLLAGLAGNTEGGGSDLVGGDATYEVKAYADPVLHPGRSVAGQRIHTAASSTFGPNNKGPVVKRLLEAGDYAAALRVCVESGYAKNDFYIYTNTRGFRPTVPFSYVVLPTATVLAHLSPDDPRVISRDAVLGCVHRVEVVDADMVAAAVGRAPVVAAT